MVDPEDPVFVAVEGNRFAMLFHIGAGGLTIGKEAFMWDKEQFTELSDGIVIYTREGAFGSPRFKPGVLCAVDLHQLPEASPPLSQWMDGWLLCPLGLPHPFCNHDPAHAFSCVL